MWEHGVGLESGGEVWAAGPAPVDRSRLRRGALSGKASDCTCVRTVARHKPRWAPMAVIDQPAWCRATTSMYRARRPTRRGSLVSSTALALQTDAEGDVTETDETLSLRHPA